MNLVEIKKDKAVVSSRIIAEGFEKHHKSIVHMLIEYAEDFERFGKLINTEKNKGRGKPEQTWWLNEDQALLMGTYLRNSPKAREFKVKLVEEFSRIRSELANIKARQSNPEWVAKREAGKIDRKESTNAIKKLVEYATSQGSKNAKHYYSLITNMEHKALFYFEGKYKNIRDLLSGQELARVQVADMLVVKKINECIEKEMYYKEIYQEVKAEIESFVALVGKSIIPTKERKEIE
jgi:phage regulator Rha-like protein